METQKTKNMQSSLEKEKWSRRNDTTWLQTILQSSRHLKKKGGAYYDIKTYETVNWNGQKWVNLIQMTIISTTMDKNSLGEME